MSAIHLKAIWLLFGSTSKETPSAHIASSRQHAGTPRKKHVRSSEAPVLPTATKGTPLELDLDVSRAYNPCAVRLHVSIQLLQKLLSEKQASNQPEPGC